MRSQGGCGSSFGICHGRRGKLIRISISVICLCMYRGLEIYLSVPSSLCERPYERGLE